MSPQDSDPLTPGRRLEEAWQLFGQAGGERPDWRRFLPTDRPAERGLLLNLCLTDIDCRLTIGKEAPPLAQDHAVAARRLGLDDYGQYELLRFEYDWCCREYGRPPSKLAYLTGCPQLASRIERDLVPPVAAPGGIKTFPCWFGRFRLDEHLGTGGMGDVFLAYDTRLCCMVALKIPRIAAGDEHATRRFRREARIGRSLTHPFLCRVHECGKIGEVHYLTMPVIKGKPLSEAISHKEPWDERRAAEFIRRLATALQELHEGGIIHRDLKPKNVMVQDGDLPMLMDFGLARSPRLDSRQLTLTGQVLGTPAYMSPEMIRGKHREVGPATDVYSLGTMLYELLTGRPPFHGRTIEVQFHRIVRRPPKPPSERRSGLSPALEAICLKALAKRPQDRQQNMAELEGELAAFLGRDAEAPTPPMASSSEVVSPVRQVPPSSSTGQGSSQPSRQFSESAWPETLRPVPEVVRLEGEVKQAQPGDQTAIDLGSW